MPQEHLVVRLYQLRMGDVERVGGKNASLGEMINQLAQTGIRVPGGFATTAEAFRDFLAQSGLDKRIAKLLNTLNSDDVDALAQSGAQIREWIVDTPFSATLEAAIAASYQEMMCESGGEVAVAVRSSATAEDMPDASFAGQQETFLNIRGLANVMIAMKHVFASLYNDRAISYRVHQGYAHADVALSAGVQRLVKSASSGVMFTMDT